MSRHLPVNSTMSVFFSGQGVMVGLVALMIWTIVSSNNSHRPTLTPQFNMSLAAAAASRTEGNDTRIAYDTFGWLGVGVKLGLRVRVGVGVGVR